MASYFMLVLSRTFSIHFMLALSIAAVDIECLPSVLTFTF